MADLVADVMHDFGLAFSAKPIRVRNNLAGSAVRGSVVQFGLTVNQGGTLHAGDELGPFSLVGAPPSAVVVDGYALCAVLAEDLPGFGTAIAYLWHQRVKALVDALTTVGMPLTITQTNGSVALDASPSAAAKVVAIAQEAVAAPGLCWVTFYGLHGFGKGAP